MYIFIWPILNMTRVYASLKNGANEIVQAVESDRAIQYADTVPPSPLPLAPVEITDRIAHLWRSCSANIDAQHASSSKHVDLLRTALELVGKDVVIAPIASAELDLLGGASDADQCRFHTALQDRLDIILTLYEAVFASNSGQSVYCYALTCSSRRCAHLGTGRTVHPSARGARRAHPFGIVESLLDVF